MDSTIPLLFQSLAIFCACTARFVSDLFGNHIVGFPMRWLKSNKQSLHVFCTRFEVQVYAERSTRLALITWSCTVTSFCAFYIHHATNSKTFSVMMEDQIFMSVLQYIFLDQDHYQRKWRVWFLRRWFTIQTLNIEFKGKADIILNTLILFIE